MIMKTSLFLTSNSCFLYPIKVCIHHRRHNDIPPLHEEAAKTELGSGQEWGAK